MSDLRVLRVFIASPGGIEAERAVVRNSAEELNLSLRDHGWRIEVYGWEERGPKGGRAQADINAEVRRCQVFVGVVWDRWGTPTGSFDSGFEEEWSIATERFSASGQPDLWLFFKTQPPRDSSSPEQLELVTRFRRKVEDTDAAFHKSFETTTEFESQIRARLLSQILFVSGLTKSDLDHVPTNWTSSFRKEPVSLVSGGEYRERLAEELLASDPHESSRIFLELSDAMSRRRFESQSESFKRRACSALILAGDLEAAIRQARSILRRHAWWLESQDADMFIRSVEDEFPPEMTGEFRAWRACCLAPRDPEGSARTLREAIGADYAIPIDQSSLASWKLAYWQCLMHLDRARDVPVDSPVVTTTDVELSTELVLLQAEAMRQIQHPGAAAAWSDAHQSLIERSLTHPEISARMTSRWALDQFTQGAFDQAESSYVDAAVRWSSTPGGSEEAARAFLSAQAAGRFREDWKFEGWGWGEMATSLPNSFESLSQKGNDFRRRALESQVREEHEEAADFLTSALWLFRRAGLIEGILATYQQLGIATNAAGDYSEAVRYFCLSGDSERARAAAFKSNNRSDLVAALGGDWPSWSSGARLSCLAVVGSSASPGQASDLAAQTVEMMKPSERIFDNTEATAAEALKVLGVALPPGDPSIEKIRELAVSTDYRFSTAGRTGLRMLEDLRPSDDFDLLVDCFCNDDRCDEPNPEWVASRIQKPRHKEMVAQAALEGKTRPLLAAILAGLAEESHALSAYCRSITFSLLNSDIGMTEDGEGIHGLMALDVNGHIAAASKDLECQRKLADALLLYACESRWPKVNRVSAVHGLAPLLELVGDESWFHRLKPLASPRQDLELESSRHLNEMWSEPGDLEAAALWLASRLPFEFPKWFISAWNRAQFDRRPPLRAVAWHIAGSHAETPFEENSARYALNDDSVSVRIAAIRSWARNRPESLAEFDCQSLIESASLGERLALIEVIAKAPNPSIAEALISDDDAYVRGIAKSRLI